MSEIKQDLSLEAATQEVSLEEVTLHMQELPMITLRAGWHQVESEEIVQPMKMRRTSPDEPLPMSDTTEALATSDPKEEQDTKHIDPADLPKVAEETTKEFSIPAQWAKMSALLKTMMEADPSSKECYPVPNVSPAMMKLVIDYMKTHFDNPAKDIEKPLKSANMQELVSVWDAKFMELPKEQVFELILAANYLDVPKLVELGCIKIATLIKGKSTAQIREEFNIVNDFTPAEEAAVIAENKWAEENPPAATTETTETK